MSRNSFFSENYNRKKVLVLVPHQDDEINVAGNLIYTMSKQGADIYVVYSTNGDYQTDAEIRIKEAFKSLHILGIPKENIIFMGYGDSYNTCEEKHISEVEEGTVESNAGHRETYCTDTVNEFAFTRRGEHSRYNRGEYCKDLKEIILTILADLIVCVDFDQHPDHRWLSLAFDEVMSQILHRSNNDYLPQVLKKFAYANAFCAPDDIRSINLRGTQRPNKNNTLNYLRDIIDYGNWMWNERVRIPVHEDLRINFLIKRNLLVKAMMAHKSQFMALRAGRIINSDEVFFERRTDSISYRADITVSTGDKKYIDDFKYIGIKDIKSKYPYFDDYLWIPDQNDREKSITFDWKNPQSIRVINLYFGISEKFVHRFAVKMDDGFYKEYRCESAEIKRIDTGLHEEIRRLSIIILDSDIDAGISEVEIFSSAEYKRLIKPYIKIVLDGNFAYDELIETSSKGCSIDVYSYGCENLDVEIETDKGIMIQNGKVYWNKKIKKFHIKAKISDDVYDEVIVQNNKMHGNYVEFAQKIDRLWISKFKICESLHRWKTYVIEQGMVTTVLRLVEKLNGARKQ